jgi:Fe-S cluster assembly protein SufD
MNSKPELEIYADDVKCSHGSTTGQFDEEALFYLRARGIGEISAKNMLVQAFANDVLNKIKHPSVKDFVEQKLIESFSRK